VFQVCYCMLPQKSHSPPKMSCTPEGKPVQIMPSGKLAFPKLH